MIRFVEEFFGIMNYVSLLWLSSSESGSLSCLTIFYDWFVLVCCAIFVIYHLFISYTRTYTGALMIVVGDFDSVAEVCVVSRL